MKTHVVQTNSVEQYHNTQTVGLPLFFHNLDTQQQHAKGQYKGSVVYYVVLTNNHSLHFTELNFNIFFVLHIAVNY